MPAVAIAAAAAHPPAVSVRLVFAVRFLGVRRDPERLGDLWDECRATWERDRFVGAIERVTSRPIVHCGECSTAVWEDDAHSTSDGERVCDSCCDDYYSTCYHCERLCRSTEVVDDESVCSRCLDRHYSWCDDCDRYVDRDHWHECSCEPRHLRFLFPANGQGTVANDRRLTVTLPAGVIDDSGLAAIVKLVHGATGDYQKARTVYDLDNHWVTREGNFTRRLSRVLYNEHGIKLPSGLISEVGNVARMNSTETSTWYIEFTRGLNSSAAAFYHDDSCWWGDHSNSRCALKTCGGLALRSYESMESMTDAPNGRAWVMPLDGALAPTHATDAHAYVVFNEYGAMEGYVATRLIAHLTGKTYSRISFDADPMFVNGETAFLVAEQAVCEATKELILSLPTHAVWNAA